MENFTKHAHISLEALDPKRVQQMALYKDCLALVADDSNRLTIINLAQQQNVVPYANTSLPQLGAVALSASLRYVLLSSTEHLQAAVQDLQLNRTILELESTDTRSVGVAAAFIRWKGQDVLLFTRTRYVLEGYFLATMRQAFTADCKKPAFIFHKLVPLNDENTFVALGHFFSEGKDSLWTLTFDELVEDPQAAARVAVSKKGISDYAYRLAAGPCGTDSVVLFRDPQDDEEPDEGDDPAEMGDVENFHGLYIRRLADGALVERIPYEAPIATGAPLFATATTVVVGCPDRIDLVPRQGVAGGIVSIPTRVYAFDPAQARLALLTPAGELELWQLTP